MAYFTRTEENMEDIDKSLLRGHSVNVWRTIGKDAWFHLYMSPHEVVKECYLKVFNKEIIFYPTSIRDRIETYSIIKNAFNLKNKCSIDEYIINISDDVIFVCCIQYIGKLLITL